METMNVKKYQYRVNRGVNELFSAANLYLYCAEKYNHAAATSDWEYVKQLSPRKSVLEDNVITLCYILNANIRVVLNLTKCFRRHSEKFMDFNRLPLVNGQYETYLEYVKLWNDNCNIYLDNTKF